MSTATLTPSHRGTPEVITYGSPVQTFDEDNLIWIVTCTECDAIYANIRLSDAQRRMDEHHGVATFVNPMKRVIDTENI